MARRERASAQVLLPAPGDELPVWERNMNAEQLEVIRHEGGPIGVYAGAGCHRAGQLVLMLDGTRRAVEDVRVGDLLLGPDSKPRRVLALARGRERMVRVVPVKGAPFVVNAGHLLTVVHSVSGEVRDVEVRDVGSLPKRKEWKLLRASRVEFDRGSGWELPIDPYFLGVLLGDGTMQCSVGVSKPDQEIVDEVYRQAGVFGLAVRKDGEGTSATYCLSAGSNKGKARHHNALVMALRRLGLFGTTSGTRFIPEAYLTACSAARIRLLAGILDTDGSLSGGCYDFISKSPDLAHGVAFVARSLGLAAYVSPCEKWDQNGQGGTYWRVSISGEVEQIPCRIPRKKAGPRRQVKNVLRTGFSLETLGVEDYYGFQLDGDQRYLLGDFTVTHNSGKTRALVHRVVRLIEHVGVSADRIFCVTFSRPGAAEMDARIRQLGVGGAEVKTWHAFCSRVLREEGTPYGRWKVDEKKQAETLVKRAGGYEYENWKGMDATKVRSFITVCKANYFWPSDPRALELARRKFGPAAQKAVNVYAKSEELIEGAQLLTFDNMLMYVVRLFSEREDVRASWAAKFDYVLQDEAQDANPIQIMIASFLARDHRNYMIVGDPGQSIFAFRGSDPKYLTDFATAWPGAKIVTMKRNYRSGDAIVRVANDVIRQGKHRLPEDMSAERGVEGRVEVVNADTLDDEAEELVEFCRRRQAEGASLADVTALFRLNAQSRALEEALLRAKIPYVLIGGVNFYERKEVKDLLAYLRLATGRDKDGDAVKRCINAPFRFLGARFVEKVMAVREQYGAALPWTDVTKIAAQQAGIQQRQRESVREWVELLEMVSDLVENGLPVGETLPDQPPPACSVCGCESGCCGCVEHECVFPKRTRKATAAEVLDRLVRRTNYVAWLEKEEGEESIEGSHGANVRELQRVAGSFESVPEFLDFVEVQVREAELNKRKRGDRCVTMMSVHKSKGLEWPVVWVVGCNDTILPHAKGDLEEERRLMYVAATRARDHLVVSYVNEMATRTGVRPVERSPFLSVFPGVLQAEADREQADAEDEIQAALSAAGWGDYAAIDAIAEATRVADAVELDAFAAGRNPGSVITEEDRLLAGGAEVAVFDPVRAAKAFGLR